MIGTGFQKRTPDAIVRFFCTYLLRLRIQIVPIAVGWRGGYTTPFGEITPGFTFWNPVDTRPPTTNWWDGKLKLQKEPTMAKRTPKNRKQSEPLAPVLNLVPKLPCNEVSFLAENVKAIADAGEGIGIGFVLLVRGREPIINTFGISYEQRYQTIGALMRLVRDLQDWEE